MLLWDVMLYLAVGLLFADVAATTQPKQFEGSHGLAAAILIALLWPLAVLATIVGVARALWLLLKGKA